MTVANSAGAAIKQAPNKMNKAELAQSNDVANFNFTLPRQDTAGCNDAFAAVLIEPYKTYITSVQQPTDSKACRAGGNSDCGNAKPIVDCQPKVDCADCDGQQQSSLR